MPKKRSHQPGSIPIGPGLLVSTAAMKWQRMVNRALEGIHLTATQYSLLSGVEVLALRATAITQTHLSMLVGTDLMLTSKHVRILEKMGLLKRDMHPTDTRARSLSLTKEGSAVLKKAHKTVASVESEFFIAASSADKVRRALAELKSWTE